jgi:hypothetical protein
MIKNGFVHIPEDAPWLAEYLHELTVFPKGKHDDQADSTAQFLDWFKMPMPGWGIFEWARQRAQELEQRRKPPPVKTVWARGSMEWLAEQEKARSTAASPPVPHTRRILCDTARRLSSPWGTESSNPSPSSGESSNLR